MWNTLQSVVHIASLPTNVTVLDHKIVYGGFGHDGAQLICWDLGQRKCRSSVGDSVVHREVRLCWFIFTRLDPASPNSTVWRATNYWSNGIVIVRIRGNKDEML